MEFNWNIIIDDVFSKAVLQIGLGEPTGAKYHIDLPLSIQPNQQTRTNEMLTLSKIYGAYDNYQQTPNRAFH